MEQQFNPYVLRRKPNSFEFVGLSLSIASILSSGTFYFSFIFGGLAILFALLSRGDKMQFSPRAKWSIIFAIIGIILAIVLFVVGLHMLLEEYGNIENILRYYSEISGVDFEEEFGILFE